MIGVKTTNDKKDKTTELNLFFIFATARGECGGRRFDSCLIPQGDYEKIMRGICIGRNEANNRYALKDCDKVFRALERALQNHICKGDGKISVEIIDDAFIEKTIAQHVDEDDALKQGLTDSLGRTQPTIFINDSGGEARVSLCLFCLLSFLSFLSFVVLSFCRLSFLPMFGFSAVCCSIREGTVVLDARA